MKGGDIRGGGVMNAYVRGDFFSCYACQFRMFCEESWWRVWEDGEIIIGGKNSYVKTVLDLLGKECSVFAFWYYGLNQYVVWGR